MLSDDDALLIASELRSRRRSATKRNVKADKPLKVLPKAASADTHSSNIDTKRAALNQVLEVLDLLPPNSIYAKHRRATVTKALQLLNAERSAEQDTELEKLLERLDIK